MGGGGSRYFSSDDAKSAREQLKEAEERSARAGLDSEVADIIESQLDPFRAHRKEVGAVLTAVAEVLQNIVAKLIDLRLGGLASRQDQADGVGDSDFVAVVDDCGIAALDAGAARVRLEELLHGHFPGSTVKSAGDLLFSIETGGTNVFILIGVSCDGVTRLPSSTGWITVDPSAFANLLTELDQTTQGRLVEVLKIAKAINDAFPKAHRLSGTHLEAIALQVFANYHERATTKHMLEVFFAQAQHLVLQHIQGSNGDRVPVDGYLGDPDSRERNLLSNELGRISRRMKNADAAVSIDEWRDVLTEKL